MTGNAEERRVESRGAGGRRVFRWILAVFAVPIALGLLAVLAFAASERVRLYAVDRILPTVERSLPGKLAIGERSWPTLGEIELGNVAWTDEGDTLFHAGEIALELRIGPLLKRDVHVERVALRRATADLPAIGRRFPADTTGAEAPRGEKKPPAFPRDGAVPGAPSLAVDTVVVEAFEAIFDSGRVVVRKAALSGDLLKGHAPGVRISRLQAADPERGWRVEATGVTVGLEPLRVDGRIGAGFQDLNLTARLTSPRDEAVRITVQPEEEPAGEPSWGADLTAALQRTGFDVTAADLEGEVRLPGTAAMARYAFAAESVEGLPPLEGPRLTLTGRFAAGPVPTARLRVVVGSAEWIEGGLLVASLEGETARLDTLRLDLPGLRSQATGRFSPDSLRARLELSLRSAELMGILAPEATRPERIALDLRAEASGPAENPDYDVRLSGTVTHGGQHIEDILVAAAGRAQGAVTFTYRAVTAGLRIAGAGRADLQDVVEVDLTAIQVVDARRRPPTPTADQATAHVRYDPRTGALELRRLRVTGDMGELTLAAALDARRRGTFDVTARWPRPPRAALAEVVKQQEQLDSLSVRWRRHGPFAVDLAGDLDLADGGSPRISARGSFRLPGPRTLSPLLPPGPLSDSLDALGAVEVNLALETAPAAGGTAFDFDFDLEPTAWLEQGRLHVVSDGRIAEIDTLGLAVDGVLLTARGRGGEELLDFEADLDVEHARFVRRFLGEAGSDLETGATLDASLGGTPSAPDVAIRLGASGALGTNAVDTLNASARWRGGRLDAVVDAAGIVAGALALDEAGVSFASTADSLLPARVSLVASGPDLGVRLGADVAAGDSVEARVDTLAIQLRKETLANAGPFRIATPHRGRGVHVDGLHLKGSLGSLRVDGALTDRTSDCRADISLKLPEIWTLLELPAEYRPADLTARVAVTGLSRANAEIDVRGLDLGERKGLGASLILETTGEDVTARFALAAGVDSVGRGAASLPAEITLLPFSFVMRDEPISADVELTGLPIPIPDRGGDEPRHVVMDGRLLLAGTMAEPRALVVADATLPDWPRLEDHRVRIEAELVPPGGVRTEDPSVRLLPQRLDAGAAPGAVAALRWTRADASILEGFANLPLEIHADSLTARIPPTRPVRLTLESPRKIPLADLSPLLPPNMRTEGRVEVRLTADGKLEEADLAGGFRGEDVRFELADGSRATLQADLSFGGTTKRPAVTGEVEVTKGLIRVPEEQKQLHAASGEALLWKTERDSLSPENTGTGAAPAPSPAPAASEVPEIDVDVGVSIPGGLWISGRGLDVELRGNLDMQQKGTIPTVTGELSAAQGRLVFLGRSFEIDRGEALFYGGDEINPELDLSMSTRVSDERTGDLVTVRIEVKGTAQEPTFELTSDPQMQEGDIFSLLLFGTTLDELDSEQLGLLQDRARDVAASFALVQLQEKLSRQLGVDMLTIKQGSAGEETSLVIGKYLTRRALLKYEQVLEAGVEFLVNLEYSLSRHWTLETLVGPTSQSAVELNWRKAY